MEEEDLTMMTMDKMMQGMEAQVADRIRVVQREEEGKVLNLLQVPLNLYQLLRELLKLPLPLQVETTLLET